MQHPTRQQNNTRIITLSNSDQKRSAGLNIKRGDLVKGNPHVRSTKILQIKGMYSSDLTQKILTSVHVVSVCLKEISRKKQTNKQDIDYYRKTLRKS